MLLDLDSELKLPEAILAEQILSSAFISHDYQLLIRTALQGKMTVNAVCDELVAQHSRIHKREYRGDRSKGKGKSYDYGTWQHGGSQAYYVEDYDDSRSQCLSGFDIPDDNTVASAYYASEAYTAYSE